MKHRIHYWIPAMQDILCSKVGDNESRRCPAPEHPDNKSVCLSMARSSITCPDCLAVLPEEVE